VDDHTVDDLELIFLPLSIPNMCMINLGNWLSTVCYGLLQGR